MNGNLDLNHSRNVLILYATETGTAQDAADRIARQCRRVLFQSRVMSMDAYSVVSSVKPGNSPTNSTHSSSLNCYLKVSLYLLFPLQAQALSPVQ
jgi:sulfite reductase alpha subunit-like flavoprotein